MTKNDLTFQGQILRSTGPGNVLRYEEEVIVKAENGAWISLVSGKVIPEISPEKITGWAYDVETWYKSSLKKDAEIKEDVITGFIMDIEKLKDSDKLDAENCEIAAMTAEYYLGFLKGGESV